VTVPVLLGAFAAGAGLLALWIDARFPSLAPGFRVVVIHVGVAIVIAQLIVPFLGNVGPLEGRFGVMLMLFAIALPALIYCFLTSVWVIKVAQGAMRRYR
jgi:hypothetical protein